MTQFIQQNKHRIQNMDGNLDTGNITILGVNITILGVDGRLEFYYFDNGVLVGHKVKVHKW